MRGTAVRGNWIGAALGLIALFVSLSAQGFAHGGDDSIVHGCVGGGGNLVIVPPSQNCEESQTPVHLSRAIAANSVGTGLLADGGVRAADIGDGEVGGRHLAPNAITRTSVTDNAITGTKVEDNSISSDDYFLASLTTGAKSKLDKSPSKVIAATCPNGTVPTGGGYELGGSLDDQVVTESASFEGPSVTGWIVQAKDRSPKKGGKWIVRLVVRCVVI